MIMDSYLTLADFAQEEIVIKKSRFIGYARPVTSDKEACEFINEIKAMHRTARHNVYAYVLRDENYRRYSDDGEPQGTAGMPVLDVLVKGGLTDCAVVVTRYFGGILLGTGGLVHAYSTAAKLAVESAGIIERALCSELTVEADYSFYGRLSSLISEFGGEVGESEFTDNVKLHFFIPAEKEAQFNAQLIDASFGKFESKKIGSRFFTVNKL